MAVAIDKICDVAAYSEAYPEIGEVARMMFTSSIFADGKISEIEAELCDRIKIIGEDRKVLSILTEQIDTGNLTDQAKLAEGFHALPESAKYVLIRMAYAVFFIDGVTPEEEAWLEDLIAADRV